MTRTVSSAGLGHLDVGDLLAGVRRVQQGVAEVGQHLELTVDGLEQGDVLDLVVEFFFAHHAVFDEDADVLPVFLVIGPLVLEQLGQLVGDLADDVAGQLADIGVVLQEAAGDVERQVGAVDAAFEQEQEFRDDFLDVVGDENLVVIDLDPPFQAFVDIVGLAGNRGCPSG